jgi:hypothetical protein
MAFVLLYASFGDNTPRVSTTISITIKGVSMSGKSVQVHTPSTIKTLLGMDVMSGESARYERQALETAAYANHLLQDIIDSGALQPDHPAWLYLRGEVTEVPDWR